MIHIFFHVRVASPESQKISLFDLDCILLPYTVYKKTNLDALLLFSDWLYMDKMVLSF